MTAAVIVIAVCAVVLAGLVIALTLAERDLGED